jgi:hypothetical protein
MPVAFHPLSLVQRFLPVLCGLLIAASGTHSRADTSDDILLSVTGPEISHDLTRADLEEIGIASFQTTTIWTDGIQEFTGTPLNVLVAALGLEEGAMQAIAANDYAVEVPLSDAVEDGPIIAFLRNGEPMTLRDNGPLWLVYPYDHNSDYQSEIIYARSIWQLERIVMIAP